MGVPVSAIKTSFGAGEVSPSLWYRVDLTKYAAGARHLLNWIVHPQGGASNRPGTHKVVKGKISGKKIKQLPFEFSKSQRYMIEAGDFYMRFCTNLGQIAVSSPAAWVTSTAYVVGNFVVQGGFNYYCIVAHTSGTFATDLAAAKWVQQDAYEIPSIYAEADLPYFNYAQSADTLFLVNANAAAGAVGYKPKMLQRLGNASWQLVDYPFKNGPFMLPNTTTANTITSSATALNAATTLTASVAIFNALHVGALFQLKHYIQGQTTSVALAANGSQAGIKCGSTWRIITHGTWAGKIAVEKSTDSGATWTNIRTFASTSDNNVNTFGTEDNGGIPFQVRVTMSGYVSGTANIDLTTDAFYQFGVVKITGYTDTTHVTGTIMAEVGLTTATIDWAEGSWSDYRGWPANVVFAQDRLVFGATKSEPYTNWMTKTNDYYDFIRHSPLLDTDGITVNLPARQLNAINGLVPFRELISFTSSASWATGPASGAGALIPSTVSNQPQDYYGSYGIPPIVIGTRAIYVDDSGGKLRDLGFQLQDDGFTGNHISVLAEHIFLNKTVVALAYQASPDTLIWGVLSDGTAFSCTYLREQDVIAFTPINTQGTFEDVSVIQGDGFREVWFVVKRGTERYMERLDRRLNSLDPADQFFVDCGVTYYDPKTISGATKANPCVLIVTAHGYTNGDLIDIAGVLGMTQLNGKRYVVANVTANTFSLIQDDGSAAIDSTAFSAYVSGGTAAKCVTTVTGLSHLNNQNVSVLGNGNVLGNYESPLVVSGNQLVLPEPCSKVQIGYGYLADLETLNFDIPQRDGTIQGKRAKISKVVLQMLFSRGGRIGVDFTRLNEIEDNFRNTYGTALELYTGEAYGILDSDYEIGARVCVRQSDPLPITVATIIPDITAGGLTTVQR